MSYIVMNEIIRLHEVSKTYKKSDKKILDNISLTIYENEFITIGGESGAGKSTLLRILGFIDPHFSGTYYYLDRTIKQDAIKDVDSFRSSVVGMVFQDYNLIIRYTIKRNLELALIAKNVPFNKRNGLIKQALKKVHLNHDILSRYPHEISGGQKQRIAIARAILCEPKILIADEPTGSLDDKNAKAIMMLFHSLDITLIIATHDLRIAKQSDRHFHVKGGSVYVT